jgi:hypothetical protein
MKMIKSLVSVTALTSAAFAIGCGAEDVSSEDVLTSGMYAKYSAVSSGDGSTLVEAELRVGGDNGTYVEIAGDDELVALADEDGDGEDESEKMEHDSSGDRHWYRHRFETDADNTKVTVAFNRGEDFESAPDSFVELPKPFVLSLDGLEEGAEIPRGTDVTVTWSNEDGGDVNWYIEGDCIWSRDDRTTDDMEFTIPAEEIEVLGTDEGESCTVEIIIERTRLGTVDSAFEEGGEFWGIQRRGIEFTSTPAPGEGEGGDGDGAGGEGGSN